MDLPALVQVFGLPVAAVVFALLAGQKRIWVWGREIDACEVRMEAMRAEYERRLEEQRKAHDRREQELAAASERWQALFFQMLGPINGLAEAIRRTTPSGGQGA